MLTIRSVEACPQCGVHWYVGFETAACTDHTHVHRRFESHQHRTPVTLPDGSRLIAVSFDRLDPYSRDHVPDYGLYLDPAWSPSWAHEHVRWPDFGVPEDPAELTQALRSLTERMRAGQVIELGCLGGHGRTGTALACLATLSGCPRGDAIRWVRENYCEKAVETAEQEAFVDGFDGAGSIRE